MSDESRDIVNQGDEKPKVRRRIRWKLYILLFLVAVIVFGPHVYMLYRFWGLHDIGDPFDVESFGTVHVPPEDNAWLDYQAATAMLEPLPHLKDRDIRDDLGYALQDGWPDATVEIQQWLLDNQPALERWRLGTEKPEFLFIQPADATIETDFSPLSVLSTFSQLSKLEALRLISEDQPELAWQWCQASLRCNLHVQKRGGISQRLTSSYFFTHSALSIITLSQLSEISDEFLNEMLVTVRETNRQTEPFSIAVRCEYLSLKNTMNGVLSISSNKLSEKLVKGGIYYFTREPRVSHLVSQQYFANWLNQCDRPIAFRQPCVNTSCYVFKDDPQKELPTDMNTCDEIGVYSSRTLLFSLLEPGLAYFEPGFRRLLARQLALEICLASRIYQRRNGTYPDEPQELVTAGLIEAIPVDPFSVTGEPMKYRRDGEIVTVWSIYENETDEGGIVGYSKKHGSMPDMGYELGKKMIFGPGKVADQNEPTE